MIMGRAVLPTTTPVQPWHVPIAPNAMEENKRVLANVTAETRARAYELARAELPATATRAAVMAAADEIFDYLVYGRKPSADGAKA